MPRARIRMVTMRSLGRMIWSKQWTKVLRNVSWYDIAVLPCDRNAGEVTSEHLIH